MRSARLLHGIFRNASRGASTLVRQSDPASSSWTPGWELSVVPAAALLFGTSTSLCEDGALPSFARSTQAGPYAAMINLKSKQRLFFKYEKRIREMSTVHKVFEYFSTGQESDGGKYMLPQDMLSALRPIYPASQSDAIRSGSLADGKMTYEEFSLVLTLLSIQEDDLNTVFLAVDADGSGQLDIKEFTVVLSTLHSTRPIDTSMVPSHGLMKHFFGPDLKGTLSFKVLLAFIRKMHEDIELLEFNHYDSKKTGYMLGIDFARSIAAAAPITKVDTLLDKADSMPAALQEFKLTLPEFREYYKVIAHLPLLKVTLEFLMRVGRPITKQYFADLCFRVTGARLSENVLNVVFTIFAETDGLLNSKLFLDVQQRRTLMPGKRIMDSSDPSSLFGQMSTIFTCLSTCSS